MAYQDFRNRSLKTLTEELNQFLTDNPTYLTSGITLTRDFQSYFVAVVEYGDTSGSGAPLQYVFEEKLTSPYQVIAAVTTPNEIVFTGIEVKDWTVVANVATTINVTDCQSNVVAISLLAGIPLTFKSCITQLEVVTAPNNIQLEGEQIL